MSFLLLDRVLFFLLEEALLGLEEELLVFEVELLFGLVGRVPLLRVVLELLGVEDEVTFFLLILFLFSLLSLLIKLNLLT
ncbi:hypothetical protein SDC9_165310 [bioreactor metagenome]|uniref:Uncharacterized protein n=1 Tax=bioreactor metagenome TaxID=1076179 RepID=A0A645FW91_9ZZZZ